jgi:hypothetical protein
MGNYDGILESWYEDCLKFVEGKVGKVPPHVVGFLGSDAFELKHATASGSKPQTYAFRTQRGQSISDIAINLEELMKLPPHDMVLNFFLGLIEEILHTRYGLTKNEVEIGEMTNSLTERYLGIRIDNDYKKQSSERRRLIDKGASSTA